MRHCTPAELATFLAELKARAQGKEGLLAKLSRLEQDLNDPNFYRFQWRVESALKRIEKELDQLGL